MFKYNNITTIIKLKKKTNFIQSSLIIKGSPTVDILSVDVLYLSCHNFGCHLAVS